MRITYSVAASLDGFIAREDGDVSWLDDLNIDADEAGLKAFFRSIDGLVMGRRTYDFVFDYGSWPYEDKPTWVCTHNGLQPLAGANLLVVDDVDEVVKGATSKNIEHLWLVGGGRLASSFLAKGLITHLSISEMPITLGAGIPLFANHQLEDIALDAQEVIVKGGFRRVEMTIKRGCDTTMR